jgi:OOP family OmpA-OmpF porin
MKYSTVAGLMCSAVLSATIPAQAAEKEYAAWGAGFFEIYQASDEKPPLSANFEDGTGFGIELGKQFSDHWAARFEFAHQDINANTPGFDQSGDRFGVDALLLLDESFFYLFGGVKLQDLDRSYKLLNVGVGKHWQVKDNWRIVTEVANYFDTQDSYSDIGLKVGLAYNFGGTKTSSARNKDSDNDGVYDHSDECPTTPAGQEVDHRGCSLDSDNDGVLNGVDQCPNTPRGARVDSSGCSIAKDSDNDGVADDKDQCPNSPRGAKVNAVGCSVDTDKDQDGVIDRLDQCPNTPRTDKVDRNGCSIFTDKEVSISLNVKFDNNSAEINRPGHPDFVDFAAFLKRFPETKAEISGHTSRAGDADYNLTLSKRRAEAVKALLISRYGIEGSRLTAVGYGEERLLDASGTAEAARVNRRIEAVVTANEKVKQSR